MSLKHGLLGLLNYGPMTGYDLSIVFNDSLSFFWQAKSSQIYRELNAMEKTGWLCSEHIIQTDKPNKRLYSITDAGKSELQKWLASPEIDIAEAMRVRSAFLMRVFFAGETNDDDAIKLLEAFLQECMKTVEKLGNLSNIIPQYAAMVDGAAQKSKYWRIAALFGESYYQAEIEWAYKALAILKGDKNESHRN
ncbi:PadR family transcriptional regulator [Eubacteriales bacterium OttesenSCG-928-K08]|nr:PadR family transcriptional regulator [Eubacteriales bacterium OttesenSCG-928-K08]